ncbi:MAG: hypothetical protein U1F36_17960 [Planctomycetota bacterium]
MIKRIVIALALIAVSFLALHFLIGFDNLVSAGGGSRQPVQPVTQSPPSIVVGGAERGDKSPIAISLSGPFELEPKVEIPMPDGSRRRLRRYSFKAEDSATVSADLLHLDRVTVLVYRIDEEAKPPAEEHVATVTAREALVQLGRDAEGRPSIREDRDMDLADVVVTSTPASRLRDTRLTIARAKVRQDDEGLFLRTPDDQEPFTVTMGGEDPLAITGRGLDAFLPKQQANPHGELRLDVAHDPDVVRGELRLHGAGDLRYREDVADGTGHLAMRGGVTASGLLANRGRSPAIARGDTLDGFLCRYRDTNAGGTQHALWNGLLLRGTPASVDVADMELRCTEIIARPALGGEPAQITASGDPTFEDRAHHQSLRAAQRIHLVDLQRSLAPLYGMVGFARARLGTLPRQLVLFEGAATVDDHAQSTSLTASGGLRALRGEGGLGVALGLGTVHVDSQHFELDGDQGCLIADAAGSQRIRLGPPLADPQHAFHVREKRAAGDRIPAMELAGHGICEMLRSADRSVVVTVRDPTADLEVRRGDDVASLISTLDASIAPDRTLRSLVATGENCTLDSRFATPRGGEERGRATGRRIEIPDGRRLVVSGAPAELQRASGGRLTGLRFDAIPFAERAPAAIVRGSPARIEAMPLRARRDGDGSAETLELEADRLVFLPSLLPTMVLRAHGLSPRSWPGFVRPHVIAEGRDGAVRSTRRDARGEQTGSSRGDLLILRPDSGAALLFGAPAELAQRAGEGRGFVARAARLRGTFGGDRERIELMMDEAMQPQIDLLGQGGPSGLGDVRLIASVPILLDGDRFAADGRVTVHGLDPTGELDPDGLDLSARYLRGTLDRSGAVKSLDSATASMSWRGMQAFADRIRVDVTKRMIEIEAKEPDGAWLESGGFRNSWTLLQIDYETREMRGWGGRGHRQRSDG